METQEYVRKTFAVNAVEVTLQNVAEVAAWCKGEVVQEPTKMMGTTALLPAVKIKGQGVDRGKDFKAYLGYFIAELKGSFRVYKPQQFWSSFEQMIVLQEESENGTEIPAESRSQILVENA